MWVLGNARVDSRDRRVEYLDSQPGDMITAPRAPEATQPWLPASATLQAFQANPDLLQLS